MKTVTLNQDNRSILLAEDFDVVTLKVDHVRRNAESIYGLPAVDVTLHTGVTPPEDWSESKYLFDGSTWTENPNWINKE